MEDRGLESMSGSRLFLIFCEKTVIKHEKWIGFTLKKISPVVLFTTHGIHLCSLIRHTFNCNAPSEAN